MTSLPILRFLERCYQADNRQRSLLDLFARKVEYRYFVDRPGDLVSGVLPHVPLARDAGKVLEKARQARVQQTEKELLLGLFTIVGSLEDETGASPFCAPLYLAPAAIADDDGQPLLSVDFERQQVNDPLLRLLGRQHDLAPEAVEDLAAGLPRGAWDLSAVAEIAERLAGTFPQIETGELAFYPRPATEGELRTARRRAGRGGTSAGLTVLFAAALVMIPRSIDSRNVLSELHRLAEGERMSQPLRRLLGLEPDRPPAAATPAWNVPAVLSRAQQQVLANAAVEPLSLVIGPPGTGKSFTIAALALDALQRGESVLVASKMDHAVDVVADKIEQLLDIRDFVVRGGRKQYRKELRTSLEQLRRGILPLEPLAAERREALEKAARRRRQRLGELGRRLEQRAEIEERWGTATADLSAPLPRRLRARLERWWLDRRLARRAPYWREMELYRRQLEDHLEGLKHRLRDRLAQRLDDLYRGHRATLRQLIEALRARHASRREERFAELDLEILFRAFPIWMVRLADVGAVVPMEREIFDLAVIDEATQCDIASCLPIFQRARRVVIVGDPHQLRHLSFLSRRHQARLARRLGVVQAERFDYRSRSILDLMEEVIERQEQVSLLDEHFRSAPPIIAFSNREFYRGRLKVMQERPRQDGSCLELRHVDGSRLASGVNPAEAEAVIGEVLERVAAGRRSPAALRPSIGLLSPFRAQVDHLSRRLGELLSAEEIERHQLLIGTPFAFQGEERDLMLISLAADRQAHPSTLRFLNRPDVLNVAVTRARAEQIVFSSLGERIGAAQAGSLLSRYLEHLSERPRERTPAAPAVVDAFLRQVVGELRRRRLTVFPVCSIAGITVDLVVDDGQRSLGVDLVGHPGEFSPAFEIDRYRLFNRAGLRLMPLPFSAWSRDREGCTAAILDHLAAVDRGRGGR